MRKFYIILSSSTDYNDETKEVIAWVENPYIAISYFREYRELDEYSEMIIIETENHLALTRILQSEYDTDIEEVLKLHLVTKTSMNGRCYCIYQEHLSELFTTEYIQKHANFICDYICGIMLRTAPLIKFLDDEYNEVISNLLFVVYTYTSIKKMIRHGKDVNLFDSVDIVYFWKLMNMISPDRMIASDFDILNPQSVVFIDSGQ